ncbi:MAG: hypothetical protein KAS48_00345 [Gammaproteobacteria bacterium]|nr:hypothetical protein [Gammaproteobacteria bacterium]MCK5092418.1 hypothetical protein [Gammaproteobacteria bacterium]
MATKPVNFTCPAAGKPVFYKINQGASIYRNIGEQDFLAKKNRKGKNALKTLLFDREVLMSCSTATVM